MPSEAKDMKSGDIFEFYTSGDALISAERQDSHSNIPCRFFFLTMVACYPSHKSC